MTLKWIRVQSNEEIKAAVQCMNDAFSEVAVQFNLNKQNAPHNGAFLEFGKLKSEIISGTVLFAAINEENLDVVGCAGYKVKTEQKVELVRFAVRKCYRGLGIGVGLLKGLEKHIVSEGYSEITLGCIAEDMHLVDYYIKQGFRLMSTKSFKRLPHKVSFMSKKVKL